jgi:hypothetical protein
MQMIIRRQEIYCGGGGYATIRKALGDATASIREMVLTKLQEADRADYAA